MLRRNNKCMKRDKRLGVGILSIVILVLVLLFLIFGNFLASSPSEKIVSEDGVASLKVPENSLPEGVSMEDISVEEFSSDEFTIEGTDDVVGYRLEPEGLVLNEPVNLTLSFDFNTSGEIPLPLLFHVSGDDVELMNNVEYYLSADGLDISVPVSHFSVVYVKGAQKKIIRPVIDPDPVTREKTGFYHLKSDFRAVKAKVGDEFNIRAGILKKVRETTLTFSSGSKFVYKIVPGTEKIKGHFSSTVGIISPKKVTNYPKLIDFDYEYHPVEHKFTCLKKGKTYLLYFGYVKWDEERHYTLVLAGGDSGIDKYMKVNAFVMEWEIECIEDVSCAENTLYGYKLVPYQVCKDDCNPVTEYCENETCTCRGKTEVSCAGDFESFEPYHYICIDDCPDDEICHTRTCTCKPYPKEGEVDIVIEEISEHEERVCTPDPHGLGEIKVIQKSGSGDWEVEYGMLYFNWKLKHMNPQQSIGGIRVDFRITGPEEATDWERNVSLWTRTDQKGLVDYSYPVYTKGVYTIEILHFDTFGKYCGDGDKIIIEVK